MEVQAKLKHARISAQKARLVADQIRGLPIEKALNLLSFSKKKAAGVFKELSTMRVWILMCYMSLQRMLMKARQ